MVSTSVYDKKTEKGFRPLSGSFFLYGIGEKENVKVKGFPSPVGVFLFICVYDKYFKVQEDMFPSPVGVFLFILRQPSLSVSISEKVSVPCRGLSFYIVSFLCTKRFRRFCFRPLSGSFFLYPVLCIPLFAIPESMTCGVKHPTLIKQLTSYTTSLSNIEIPTSA